MLKNSKLGILFLCIFVLLNQSFAQKKQVLVFIYEDCPISIYMTKDLSEMFDIYKKDFDFKAVFPNALSNYKTASIFLEKYKLNGFELIIDEDQSLTNKYGATITPEAIVLNEQDEILFRGRINDGYFDIGKKKSKPSDFTLRKSLDKIFEDKKVSEPWPIAKGCFITKR